MMLISRISKVTTKHMPVLSLYISKYIHDSRKNMQGIYVWVSEVHGISERLLECFTGYQCNFGQIPVYLHFCCIVDESETGF